MSVVKLNALYKYRLLLLLLLSHLLAIYFNFTCVDKYSKYTGIMFPVLKTDVTKLISANIV